MKNAQLLRTGPFIITLLLLAVTASAQFYYTTNDDTITITGYNGDPAGVIVPDQITGYPVTTIGAEAFAAKFNLQSITLPASLTSIEDGAFRFCFRMPLIAFPNSLTNIGNQAFFNAGLNNVTLPDSVASLGIAAFCSNQLTNAILSTNLTTIADELFLACNNLASITLPPNLTDIGRDAFNSCYALASVTIPSGVTNIGSGAFLATGLTNVFIPASVITVGERAFGDNGKLKTITVDAANPSYSSRDGVLFNKDQTTLLFFPRGRTGTYRIPDGVTTLASASFYFGGELQFPSPTSITVPASVTSIGGGAFSYCPDLTTLFFLGNAPTNLGGSLFYFTDNLINYYLPGTSGWTSMLDTRPTALWNPNVPSGSTNLGVQGDQFGFNITGTADIPVVIEASTNLANAWTPLQSVRLTNGLIHFSDPHWTNYPQRFYRLNTP